MHFFHSNTSDLDGISVAISPFLHQIRRTWHQWASPVDYTSISPGPGWFGTETTKITICLSTKGSKINNPKVLHNYKTTLLFNDWSHCLPGSWIVSFLWLKMSKWPQLPNSNLHKKLVSIFMCTMCYSYIAIHDVQCWKHHFFKVLNLWNISRFILSWSSEFG